MSNQGPASPRACPPYNLREQAWVILAELFRDTEFDETDVSRMAGALLALELDAPTASRILYDEVMPVFGWNLLAAAGNWQGWRDEDVVQAVRSWLARRERAGLIGIWLRSPWMRLVRQQALGRLVREEWARVARRMVDSGGG